MMQRNSGEAGIINSRQKLETQNFSSSLVHDSNIHKNQSFWNLTGIKLTIQKMEIKTGIPKLHKQCLELKYKNWNKITRMK